MRVNVNVTWDEIARQNNQLKAGEMIIMPGGKPHGRRTLTQVMGVGQCIKDILGD